MSVPKLKYSVGIGSFVKISSNIEMRDGGSGFITKVRGKAKGKQYCIFSAMTKKERWVNEEYVSLKSFGSPPPRSAKRKAVGKISPLKQVSNKIRRADQIKTEDRDPIYNEFLNSKKGRTRHNGIPLLCRKLADGASKEPGWWRKQKSWNKKKKKLPKQLNEKDKLALHTEYCLLIGGSFG